MAGREGDENDNRGFDDRERIEKLREAARQQWGQTDDDIEVIESQLDSEEAEERARAAWALAELAADDPERSRRISLERKLVPLFEDDDDWVRRGASWAVATVADEHPQRARTALSQVTDGLADQDPLVRENSVLALSDVAMEYPRAAEPALSHLADLVRNDDGLASQYAAETLFKLVRKLDEDGFAKTIASTPELAGLMPGDADVVEVTEDPSDGKPVQIRGGGGDNLESEESGARDDGINESLGPPDSIPAPPEITANRPEFERLLSLGHDPLTTTEKVRAATPTDGGQHVVAAVRTLQSGVAVDHGQFETALREWATVDDHDHVVPVLARGTTPRPWFATEFMDAGTLWDHIGSVGFERALWYAQCITTALCHAHAHGVVHGALWPGAVGLSRTLGAWPVPKVSDWGFGDLFAEERDVPVPPAFAAPEHVAPEEFGRPDPATDVYQLGALCYALFAGRTPYVGDGPDILKEVRRDAPPAPSEVSPDLPSEVDNLLRRALTKEKRTRFETVEDFRRELELLVDDHASGDWT